MSISCLGIYHVSSSLTCHIYFMLCSILFFCLSFELYFLIHYASLMHHILPLFISSFLSLLPLDSFFYLWQKEGEYTGVFHYFYMTHVHTLRGKNSTSCIFVGGESHRRDAYTKGEKTFCYKKTLFRFELYSLVPLLDLVSLMQILWYFALVVCWTCIPPYAIVFYWLHVWMIICFAIWSL